MNVIEHNRMVPDSFIQLVEDVDDAGDGIVIVKDTEDGRIYLLDFYECAEDYKMYEINNLKELIKKALETTKHSDVDVNNPSTLVAANSPNVTKYPAVVHVKVTPTTFECQAIYVRDEYKKEVSPITFEKIQAQIRAIKEILKPGSITVEFDKDVTRYIQDETTR